jgi:hypothetical protein
MAGNRLQPGSAFRRRDLARFVGQRQRPARISSRDRLQVCGVSAPQSDAAVDQTAE